jgi:hypothetical protein
MNSVDHLVKGCQVEPWVRHPFEGFAKTNQQINKAKEDVIVKFDE